MKEHISLVTSLYFSSMIFVWFFDFDASRETEVTAPGKALFISKL